MKFTHFLIAALLISSSINSFAQSVESKISSTENSGLKKSTKVSQKPHSVSYPAIENKDGYMGKKSEILEKLIASEIPKSLPKYKKGLPAEEYLLQLKRWAKNNQELLKEKYRKQQTK